MKRAPGPPGHWFWGHLSAFREDELGLVLESARAYGGVVRFRLGPVLYHLLNEPSHVEHVLARRAQNYLRVGRSASFLREISGASLLTTEGSVWREHRHLMQPVFHSASVSGLAGMMAESTIELVGRWEEAARQARPVPMASEMSRLAFTIAGRGLFGEDLGQEAAVVECALSEVLAQTFRRVQSVLSWPRWCPTAENRRFRESIAALNRVVYQIIQSRRKRSASRPDLLDLLLQARGEQVAKLSDLDLRNETIALLLAGHETTANALAWTFYLLAEHPKAQGQVRKELIGVLGKGSAVPGIEELARLPLTTCVLQESLRLYPPIWIMERHVVAEDEIGGYRIPAGSKVVMSPWVLHRDPRLWVEPEAFRPDRFAQALVPHSYIPFGLGPHQCIGRHFAMLEAKIVLAMVARRFSWEAVQPVRPKGGITLRQEPGLSVKLKME